MTVAARPGRGEPRRASVSLMPVLPVAAVLLALFVVPGPWGEFVLAATIAWELAEKAYWLRSSRRIPIAAGRETLLGQQVTALSACRPEGRVRLGAESWSARCLEGADPGERLVVEAVERITLVVRRAAASRTPAAPAR